MILHNIEDLGELLVSEIDEKLRAGASKAWNWHPDLPIALSPLFAWPPRPLATMKWFAVKWFATKWLPITELTIYALMAWATWVWLVPSLEQMKTLGWSWVLQLWARNLILMFIFAQGLHLWLYGWKKQGDDFKYDRRGMAKNARIFLWNDQYWDNVTYVVLSGVTIWTFYDAIVWMGYANGWAPMITVQSNPIWFFSLFPLLLLIQSFHFYWLHRALHIPWLYKHVHSVHHRNVSVAPWSGFSMHPIEHIGYMSVLLIFLVVPAHPIHFLFLGYYHMLGTATTHAGFENLVLGDKAHLRIGSFFHTLHHKYFECNYGNAEVPWDNWFGSFHDGSPEATEQVREAKKRMHANIPRVKKNK